MRTKLRAYYLLTKPRIIFGNLVTMVCGFLLASRGDIAYGLLLETTIGLALVIASASVFNNCIDRNLDEKMVRTRNRPLVLGLISVPRALFFGILLGLLGIAILSLYTNALAAAFALLGFFVYVILYSFLKPHSVYGTVVGSLAGATPPVVGYSAVTHSFDLGAFLLFTILVLWQMPHFFAIALYRLDEYRAAHVPLLPIKRGVYITKVHMLVYIIAFTCVAALLTFFGYTGYLALAAVLLLGGSWLFFSIQGFTSTNDTLWARNMFRFSLVVIMLLCTTISMDVEPV